MSALVLRPARSTDAGKTAAILSGFIDETDWLPRIHTRAEDVSFTADMIDRGWVTVAERDGRVIRVSDIATVSDTYRRLKNTSLLDGLPTATIVVNKESNINTLGTAQAIKAMVVRLQEQYPHIEFSTTRDVSEDSRAHLGSPGGGTVPTDVVIGRVVASW